MHLHKTSFVHLAPVLVPFLPIHSLLLHPSGCLGSCFFQLFLRTLDDWWRILMHAKQVNTLLLRSSQVLQSLSVRALVFSFRSWRYLRCLTFP
ncbi:hypothetical protein K457DRAFT_630822 [Linnemannia elongata AG-77]|uniref:Uncharacterized protein n=1 Tax=Linnemannia elongata AG-77 TaxID=1314771 RepID=A0A197JQ88_9FUNG|nr:hypothetical protein K457DRAFT_630822 [Linnemannia elongata AG-77]